MRQTSAIQVRGLRKFYQASTREAGVAAALRCLFVRHTRTVRAGATVLLTSHYMADVETLCERVIVIHHGVLLFEGR